MSLLGHIPVALVILPGQNLGPSLLLIPRSDSSGFWTALHCVAVADVLARLVVVSIKVFMLLAWPGSTDDSLRWRGQAMTALEHCSRFHRMVVPLPVWHRYFQDGAGLGVVSASMCTGMYFVYKGTLLSKSATVLFAAVRAVVRREAAFGVFAKPEEIMETGNQCAICQDAPTAAIKLPCSHIFCQKCLSET
eukprot:jgi/Astpho2/1143/Aster-07689